MNYISLFRLERNLLTSIKLFFVVPAIMGASLIVSSPVLAKPDLKIESISGVQTAYSVGAPMPVFKVRVKNIGDMPYPKLKAISVSLKSCKLVWKGYESNCKPELTAGAGASSPYINGLAAGGVVDIRWPLLWPGIPTNSFKEGAYHLVFKVDGFNEALYNNNEYTLNIPVTYPGIDSYLMTMKGIDYTGPCPKNDLKIATGTILAVHGSGYIDFHYVSSFAGDSTHIYSKAVNNKESITTGMKTVAQYDMDGWVAVKGVSPYAQMSEKGYFKIRCTNADFKKKLKVIPKLKIIPK